MSTLGFKGEVDLSLACNEFLRSFAGATPTHLLTPSIAAESFDPCTCSHTCKHRWDLNPESSVQHSVFSNRNHYFGHLEIDFTAFDILILAYYIAT